MTPCGRRERLELLRGITGTNVDFLLWVLPPTRHGLRPSCGPSNKTWAGSLKISVMGNFHGLLAPQGRKRSGQSNICYSVIGFRQRQRATYKHLKRKEYSHWRNDRMSSYGFCWHQMSLISIHPLSGMMEPIPTVIGELLGYTLNWLLASQLWPLHRLKYIYSIFFSLALQFSTLMTYPFVVFTW